MPDNGSSPPQRRSPTRRFSFLRRRPSPAMLVALVALFLSAGGASYAAVTIPAGSITATQIRNLAVTNPKLAANSVGYRKIIEHTIGAARVDSGAIQLRVGGTCTAGSQAITSVLDTGKVTCGTTLPSEYDTASPALASITSSTQAAAVASETLPGNNSFLVTANPNVQVQSNAAGAQNVQVTCVLSAGPSTSSTQSRTAAFDLNYKGDSESASIPLSVVVSPSGSSITAQVSCVRTTAPSSATPTVGVTTSINALQTASNTSTASPAPSATATITPTPAPPTTTTTTPTPTTPAS
jgi:hypothetical protein